MDTAAPSDDAGALVTPGQRRSLRRLLRHIRSDGSLRHEADTMGLYVCVALYVAMSAGDDTTVHRAVDLIALIWLSTVGLALGHWVASEVSSRLGPGGGERHLVSEGLTTHLLVATIAATVTTVVVLAVPNDVKLLAGRLSAASVLAVLIAVEARSGGRTALSSARVALLAFSCAGVIALLKRFLS